MNIDTKQLRDEAQAIWTTKWAKTVTELCDEIDRLRELVKNCPKTDIEVIYALQRILDECVKSTDGRVSIIAHDALIRAREQHPELNLFVAMSDFPCNPY